VNDSPLKDGLHYWTIDWRFEFGAGSQFATLERLAFKSPEAQMRRGALRFVMKAQKDCLKQPQSRLRRSAVRAEDAFPLPSATNSLYREAGDVRVFLEARLTEQIKRMQRPAEEITIKIFYFSKKLLLFSEHRYRMYLSAISYLITYIS
jgi:hypothetical protein